MPDFNSCGIGAVLLIARRLENHRLLERERGVKERGGRVVCSRDLKERPEGIEKGKE